MPPAAKYTREEILSCAFDLVREKGYGALTARDLGVRLGTSSRPVFTAFENMEELKNEVMAKGIALYDEYKKREIESRKYPEYKATGMSYMRFAKEEKNLFKLIFMRDRSNEGEDAPQVSIKAEVEMLKGQTSLDTKGATDFHLQMWIWVHGVATMLATSYLNWDFELISNMLSRVYHGLREEVK